MNNSYRLGFEQVLSHGGHTMDLWNSTTEEIANVEKLTLRSIMLYELFWNPMRKASRAGITLRDISALRVTYEQ